MDTWGPVNWALMIPIVAILGAFAYLIVMTLAKTRVRELEIKQRIAMIERGLVPPPEADPRGFEHVMNRLDLATKLSDRSSRANRHRRAGITMMGIGFGLMLLIGIAGDSPEQGIGVGGFLVIVGLAFVVNGWFEGRAVPDAPPAASPASLPPNQSE